MPNGFRTIQSGREWDFLREMHQGAVDDWYSQVAELERHAAQVQCSSFDDFDLWWIAQAQYEESGLTTEMEVLNA